MSAAHIRKLLETIEHAEQVSDDELINMENELAEKEESSVQKIIVDEFKKVYPNTELIVDDKIKTGDNFGLRDVNTDFVIVAHPMLQRDPESGDIYTGLFIMDAYSGEYKGVVFNIIKRATEYLMMRLAPQFPNIRPGLAIEDDLSVGTWDHITNKLGYKLFRNE